MWLHWELSEFLDCSEWSRPQRGLEAFSRLCICPLVIFWRQPLFYFWSCLLLQWLVWVFSGMFLTMSSSIRMLTSRLSTSQLWLYGEHAQENLGTELCMSAMSKKEYWLLCSGSRSSCSLSSYSWTCLSQLSMRTSMTCKHLRMRMIFYRWRKRTSKPSRILGQSTIPWVRFTWEHWDCLTFWGSFPHLLATKVLESRSPSWIR